MAPFFLFKRNSPFACPLAAQLPAVKVIRPLPALGGPHGRRPWWGRNVWGDSSTAEDLPRRGGLSAPGGRRSHGRGVRPGGKVTRRGRGEALGGRDRGQPLRGAATPRQRGRGAGAEGTWRAGQTAEPGRGIPGVRGGSRGGVCGGSRLQGNPRAAAGLTSAPAPSAHATSARRLLPPARAAHAPSPGSAAGRWGDATGRGYKRWGRG